MGFFPCRCVQPRLLAGVGLLGVEQNIFNQVPIDRKPAVFYWQFKKKLQIMTTKYYISESHTI